MKGQGQGDARYLAVAAAVVWGLSSILRSTILLKRTSLHYRTLPHPIVAPRPRRRRRHPQQQLLLLLHRINSRPVLVQ